MLLPDDACRRSVQMKAPDDAPSSTRQNLLGPIMLLMNSSIYHGTQLTQQQAGFEAAIMAEGPEGEEELLQ